MFLRCLVVFLVHRHFPWFKAKTGYRDSSMSHQYAVPQIGATESDDEPFFCGIVLNT
jgi:hypothetical protein